MKFIAGMIAGAFVVASGLAWLMPNCPTEDSCDPTYQTSWYGRHWTGTEVTP